MIIARNKRRRELYVEGKKIEKLIGDSEVLCARSNNKLAFEDNFASSTKQVVGGVGIEENISARHSKRPPELYAEKKKKKFQLLPLKTQIMTL